MATRWVWTLLLVFPLASGASPLFEVEGVEYYKAFGTLASGNATIGLDHEGVDRLPFVGCADTTFRTQKNSGRIDLVSRINNVPVGFYASKFEGARLDMGNGVAYDLRVDGSRTHDGIQHPAVEAEVVAWSPEAMATVGHDLFLDPVTGKEAFALTLFVTSTGFRDDATGRIRNPDGSSYQPGDPAVRTRGDEEMHVRVESAGGQRQPAMTMQVQEPPLGYLPPQEGYHSVIEIPNLRFGGSGTIDLASTALGRPGDNDLTFSLRDPAGRVLQQVRAEPAVAAPFSASFDMPLDHFGSYSLAVTGNVSLSRYSVSVVQETPTSFDLTFWWEELLYGSDAGGGESACRDELSGRNEALSGAIVGRPPPPPFPHVAVILTVGGSVAALLITVKMMMMARAAAVFRRLVRD